jgi:hypothetical protein
MIKMIATLCRRPGMTHAEYLAYVQHVHGAIAAEQPVTLTRYVQNHVFDAAFGAAGDRTHALVPARDSVTELYWDDPQAMSQTFAHDHVRTKVGPDGANFSDLDVALSIVAHECEQPVRRPGTAGAKVMHFLRAADGLALTEFFSRWASAHERAMTAVPAAADAIRRCVHNRQLPEFNKMLAYFGGSDVFYEGVGSLWFDDAMCVGAFRLYERALLEINADPATAFYQPSQSFFLYATEVPIYERRPQP